MATGQLFFSKVEGAAIADPQISISMIICIDLSWHARVHGHTLHASCPPLSSLPQTITSVDNVRRVLKYLKSCTVCIGNSDDKYIPLIWPRKGNFMISILVSLISSSHIIFQ